jgi:hypothetical protein
MPFRAAPAPALGKNVEASIDLMARINAGAVRRPPLKVLVDAEIASMRAWVASYGRGSLEERDLDTRAPARHGEEAEKAELFRLVVAEQRLASYLPYESGPADLESVVANTAAQLLGDDATIRQGSPENVAPSMLAPRVESDIGVLDMTDLGAGTNERIAAILEQWLAREHPLRAAVLDLSECATGQPQTAAAVAALFGASATLGLSFRDRTGLVRAVMFPGNEGGRSAITFPLFVVTSLATGSVPEALAFALQRHGATLLGGRTEGSGRLLLWGPKRSYGSLGFTGADLIGADDRALRGRHLLPDACVAITSGALTPLLDKSPEGYVGECQDNPGSIPSSVVVDYVTRLLDAAAERHATPRLERGEEQG